MIDERILKNIPGLDKGKTVACIDAKDMDAKTFAKKFVNTNTPVLIKGGLKHWPAYEKWPQPGYLEEAGKDSEVNYYRHMNFSSDSSMKASAKKHNFAQALSEMRSGLDEVLFAPVSFKAEGFKKLQQDMTGFPFIKNKPKPLAYPDARMFVYKGAGSNWHLHVLDETLMCQIHGNKRVALFSSDDGNYEELKNIFYSDALLKDENCMQHLADKIEPFVVDVEAGDTLYIPPNWWHGVQPTDHEVGMTIPYCWRSPYHKISNLRYPAIRDLYKDAFKRPGLPMLVVPFYGLLTLFAQCIYRTKLLAGR
ncbi:cupin-like domain-containing protein [Pseudoalteromonas sp. T1lg23B]|uniref:cupin-like domain-containing protein n=1 Tax=Pseudoalteromonas sp. T1lg23B TaxID=2077097 RepID=UPI000CF64F11|nr:cupin-like domain-containing protein [Pseudoalteromonas sp. T1lg23B]